jgi:putative ABC transport system permease protein
MRALSRLTFENLRKNRKRSIVTTFGVALSAALIFAVIAMATSFWNTMRDYAINRYGDFHESFEYIPGDKLSIVENAFGVESVYYARDIKMDERYLYLEGSTMPLPSEL